MASSIRKRYGLAWPAHREHIADKDISDFAMTTQSTTLPRGSGILLDIKDIHGRFFYPTKDKRFGHVVSAATNAFFELPRYARQLGHELFFGIPVLHDRMMAATPLGMINAKGEPEGTFVCPSNPAVQDLLIDLLGELNTLAPEVNLFLPFFRYPVKRRLTGGPERVHSITEDEALCFCQHCQRGFKAAYGALPKWRIISSEPRAFYDWLEWRCHTIESLARKLLQSLSKEKLVFEMDLCPKRFYLDGLFINNGHDISTLSKLFKKVMIHVFDRSTPIPPRAPTHHIENDIMYMTIERVRRHATVYLMLWNIATDRDLQVAFDYASSVDVELFVLYPNMVPGLVGRCP